MTASEPRPAADVRTMTNYTPAQAAKQLGVSPETMRKLCREGHVHAHRIGREWRIPEPELNRLIREGTGPVYPSTPPPVPRSMFGPVAAGIAAAVPDRSAQSRLAESAAHSTSTAALRAALIAASVHLTPAQAHRVRGIMLRASGHKAPRVVEVDE